MAFMASLSPARFFKPPRFVKTPFLLSYVLVFFSALLLLIYYFQLQPEVPLFYTLPQPNQHLTHKNWLAVFPISMLLIMVIHTITVNRLKDYDRLLMQIFAWSTMVMELLFTLALLRIIYIIT